MTNIMDATEARELSTSVRNAAISRVLGCINGDIKEAAEWGRFFCKSHIETDLVSVVRALLSERGYTTEVIEPCEDGSGYLVEITW